MVIARKIASLKHSAAGALPVLALHSLGLDGDAWASVASIAPTRDFHVYDQKGHGVCAHDAPTPFEDFVADARQALDHVDRPRVHLVGHSLGGAVAACLAQAAPDRVASLSLVATPLAGMDAFMQRATAQSDGTLRNVADETLVRWFGEEASGPDVETARSKIMGMTPTGFDACWIALSGFAGYEALPGPFPSTAICSFANDRSTPPAVGDDIVRALSTKCPTIRHDVIDGAGHMGVLTHAPAVSTLLAHHWQTVEAAS